MQIDETTITSNVYHKTKDGVYYIRVVIPDLQLVINSMTVRPKQNGQLWFQMPRIYVNNRPITPLEFTGISEFKDLLQDYAYRAVDQYIHDVDKNIPDENDLNKGLHESLEEGY